MMSLTDRIIAANVESMQTLDLAEQVTLLEGLYDEFGEASLGVVALHLLSVSMDLDGGEYPADLVARVERLKERVRQYNQQRFGTN